MTTALVLAACAAVAAAAALVLWTLHPGRSLSPGRLLRLLGAGLTALGIAVLIMGETRCDGGPWHGITRRSTAIHNLGVTSSLADSLEAGTVVTGYSNLVGNPGYYVQVWIGDSFAGYVSGDAIQVIPERGTIPYVVAFCSVGVALFLTGSVLSAAGRGKRTAPKNLTPPQS